jgi:hypothetical protein
MDRPTNLAVINAVSWFDEPLDWAAVQRSSASASPTTSRAFAGASSRAAGARPGRTTPAQSHWLVAVPQGLDDDFRREVLGLRRRVTASTDPQ